MNSGPEICNNDIAQIVDKTGHFASLSSKHSVPQMNGNLSKTTKNMPY